MTPELSTALATLVVGAALLALLGAGLRWARGRPRQPGERLPSPVAAAVEAAGETGVVVAARGGRVEFANDQARLLFGLDGGTPTLDGLLRHAEPADHLLALMVAEGQTQLRIQEHAIEATSIRVPLAGGERLVVVLRDAARANEAGAGTIDAETLLRQTELSRLLGASLRLDETCEAIVAQTGRRFSANLVELNLWDPAARDLQPARQVGDLDYARDHALVGGRYAITEGYTGWMARERTPLLVGNIAEYEPVRPKLFGVDFQFQSFMGVPLVAAGDLVGTLELASYQLNAFSPTDLDSLCLLGEQAAVAVRNAQHYEAQRRQVAELTGLAEMTRALEATGDVRTLYARLTSDMARFLNVELVSLMALDGSGQALAGQPPFFGMPDYVAEFYQIPLRPGSLGAQLWNHDDHWLSNDTAADPGIDELGLREFTVATGARTSLLAPAGAAGRRIGLVHVCNKADGAPFTPEDVRLVKLFAAQTAAILDNARLVREAQRRADEADGLRAIATTLTATADLDQALRAAMAQTAELLKFDFGMVALLDEARGELVPHPASVYGGEPQEALAVRLRTDDPLFALSITRTRRPFIATRAQRDRRIIGFYKELVEHFQVNSALDVPLIVSDRAIGELIVVARPENAFTRADLRLLGTIAAQLASAIERARLVAATDQNLGRRVEQLTALTRVSRELNQTLELDRILRLVHDEAVHTTRAACGSLVILDRDVGPETVALRLGDEALGHRLTPLEAEVARGQAPTRRVAGLPAGSPLAAHPEVQAALVVPILAQGQVVGLMHLHSTHPEGFDASAEEAAQALAAQTAIAVENARRFEDQIRRGDLLRRRADQLSQLFAVSRSVRSDVPLAQNLESIAFALQEAVGFNLVLISVIEAPAPSGGRRLRPAAGAGMPLAEFDALSRTPVPWDEAARLLQSEFQVSQSYFLPAERARHLPRVIDLPSLQTDDMALPGANAWQPADRLLVPLIGSGREPVGLLMTDHPRDGRRPDRSVIEIIEIFANQAAQAIENARLYAAAERRTGQLLALHRIIEAASALANRGRLWQTAAETLLAEMHGPDVAVIGLVSEGEPPRLQIAGHAGQVRPYVQFEALLAGPNPLQHALEGGGAMAVLTTADSAWGLNPMVVTLEVSSFVTVPIFSQGQPAGALLAGSHRGAGEASPFTPDDVDIYTILANQLGALLESARLETDIELRAAQLAALAELGQRVSATLRAEDVVQAVLRPGALRRVVGYDSMTLWLREGEQLRVAAAQGFENNDERLGLRVDIVDSALFAEMAATLSPISVPDVRADSRFPASELQPARSWLGAPLINKGRILGVLALDKAEPHAYPPQSAQVLMALSTQLAAALDNARLFEESEQRTQLLDERSQRLALLNRASAQLSGMLTEPQIFATTLAELTQALDVPQAMIVTLGQDGAARLAAQHPTAGERPSVAAPVVARVAGSLAPVGIEDVAGDALFEDDLGAAASLVARGVRSLLAVPLVGAGGLAAAIQLEETRRTRRFTPGEIELAQTVANQAAVAVQNAQLYAETQARADELAIVYQVSRAVAGTINLDQLAAVVGQQITTMLDVQGVYLALYDEASNELTFPLVLDRGETLTVPARPPGGLAGHILETRQPLLLRGDDISADLEALGAIHVGPGAAKSYLGVPLVAGEQVIGALAVEDQDRANVFDASSERILTTIGAQVAVAIQNARLFAQTQAALAERTRAERALLRRNDELEVLNRVTAAVATQLDLEGILRATARELVDIFHARNSGIALLNAERTHLTVVADHSAKADDPPAIGVVIPLAGNASSLHVIETGQSLVLPRAFEHPLTLPIHALLRERNTQCLAIVPLRVRGEVIGTIGLDTDQADRIFWPAEVTLVETIAGQIAGAVENARFAQQLEARVAARTAELERERERVEILLQVTTELSSSLDLDRVLTRALELVTGAIQAERGSIFLVDLESDRLIYRAALGRQRPLPPGGQPAPFKRHEGLVGWAIKHRQGTVIADVDQDPRWTPLPDLEGEQHSALVVPLLANEDSLGAMVLVSARYDAFDEAQLRLVAAAANQVGAAINNAELYRLIRDQAERLGGMLRGQQVEATKSRAILEGIADGVLVADDNGDVILFNVACERILGLDRQAVMGRPMTEFVGIYGAAGQAWTQAVERWSRDPNSYQPGEFVAQRLTIDNQTVVSVHLAPVIAAEEYLGSVSVIRDITREVEVDRLKSEFVTNVSHELRTPMTSIKGYADLLLMGAAGPLQADQARFLDIIRSNADRLSLLVNDLLDISRIESGRVQLVLRATDVGDVMRDVVATLQGRIRDEAKPMDVQTSAPSDLPAVWADRERLTQVLMNLADNAFNYTPGGGAIRLAAEHDAARGEVVIRVTDTGIGIAPEDQPRLFDRFYRGEDALVLASAGTGLGLAIARQLAEMHGGRLWLDHSEVGQGATFAAAIPLAQTDPKTQPPEAVATHE